MDIWRASCEAEAYVIRCRRWLHEHAELSDQEEQTVAFILAELKEAGIECVDVPRGGVMGFIYGKKPGKTVLLRADIDALPMQEDTWNAKQPKVCVSKHDGVAHTCGHDTHAAMLLCAARLLHANREHFDIRQKVHFNFNNTVSVTCLTTSALYIKTETSLAVSLHFCIRGRRKQVAD